MAKKSHEIWKTYEGVFDNFTLRNLFKLSSQGHFEELGSPISIGKESHIFSAPTQDGGKVIIKIHRLQTCDFNQMYKYIRTDPRYKWLQKNKRKIIFAWTQREFRNLMLARESGVLCPTPIAFKDNIIIMEFIGKDEVAPKLKDLKPENPKKFLELVIKNMHRLYKADLIHGDLSSFNILNFEEKPVFIDFSQTTQPQTPNAMELLDRDIKNIINYFEKQGLSLDAETIKLEIIKK